MTQNLLILSDQILKTLNIPQVINITDQLPKHPTKKWPKRDFNLLQGITVHHFASEAPIVNQAKYHINSHGWVGLAYTVVIRDGQILQTNYLDDRTTHASGGNDISWGVCIGGDLSKRSITDFERRALTGVSLGLKEMYPHLWVKGHNQISKTSCPCTDMNRIRADILSTEEKLEYIDSPSSNRAICYAFAERIEALGSRFADKKYGEYAKSLVMRLEPVIGELGYTGDVTPEGITKRVIEIYKNTHNSRFEGEAFKKLTSGAKFAQENGIMPS